MPDSTAGAIGSGLPVRALWTLAGLTRRWPSGLAEQLARLIYSPDARGRDWIDIVGPIGERGLIRMNTATYMGWCLFFLGSNDPALAWALRRLLRPGDQVLDIGANVGAVSLLAAEAVGDGKVTAVEAHPAIADELRATVWLNPWARIEVVERAVAATSGPVRLRGFAEGAVNQGTSSLGDEGISLEATTIDELAAGAERLDWIKVDVEGHDLDVLRGGEATLRRLRPRLIFEYDPMGWIRAGAGFDEAVAWLRGLGYELHVIRNGWLEDLGRGEPTHIANVLATPSPC
jgi:FkbM family methyltransferase